MVSNSYDADATDVKIQIDLKKKELVVEDNGNGMTVEQFDNYLEIAGEKYEGNTFSPKFGRKRIGRFGIGFLASFPFCESIEITSKKEGAENGFTAILPTKRFIQGIGTEENVSNIPVDGHNEPSSGKSQEHYTKIWVKGLNILVEEFFKMRQGTKSISIESWDGMARLKWNLCETLPLDFKNSYTELSQCLGETTIGMSVFLNGEKLFRSDPGGQIIESSGQTYIKRGNLEFKYAITTNWNIIHPVEARGLKLRMNEVGIGPRTYLEIEKEVRTFSHLNWLAGEIHILAGLEDSLAITRDSFVWTSEWQVLKEAFHVILLRAHTKVEKIAKIEKELSLTFNGKIVQTTSKKDLIDNSIKQLKAFDFQIIRKSEKDLPNAPAPVLIQKSLNRVTIIEDHPLMNDVVEIQKEGVIVRYKPFEKSNKFPDPVRMSDDGYIEVNTNYPVFRGRTKGEIMKRVHLIMFLAKLESKTPEDMYTFLVNHLRDEFGE